MMKNLWTSLVEDSLEMTAVDIKYPTVSAPNIVKRIRDFTIKIYLSRNQVFGNLFAAPIVKQNPKEQQKVPMRKK
jgi:hypothetical protein